MPRILALIAFFPLAVSIATAQTVVGVDADHSATPVKDSSMLKPPPGVKVAIIDWTDLECPSCARAFPVVHAAMDHFKVPLIHYDFLIPSHRWSAQAAVFARYLQDKVSPPLSTEYRREIFASQDRIASPDDLDRVTRQFMAGRGKPMPFVVDPTGQFKRECQADNDLGLKMGLIHTPTIFVVTQKHWIDVANFVDLDSAIEQAKAEVAPKKAAVAQPKTAR
jgi:protein-disulfide isomerase